MRKGKRKKLLSFALALSMVVTGTNVPMKQASAEEMQDWAAAEEGYTTPAPDEWYRTPAPYDEYATSVPDEWWNTTSAPDEGYATPAPDEWWNTTSAPDKNDQLVEEEDGYTAFLMFWDKDDQWTNLSPKSDSGWGNDAVITGDGTYTVSLDKESYLEYLNQTKGENGESKTLEDINPAEGVKVLNVDFNKMAEADNLDVSHMQIKDVTVSCDGKVFPTDDSKMYFGDIEGMGNLRLELYSDWGYGNGSFNTRDVFDPDGNFGFSKELSVTFTLEGIQAGKTSYSTFYEYDSEEGLNKSLVWTLDQWNKEAGPVEEPVYTASPVRTVSPDAKDLPLDEKDGYMAYILCGYYKSNDSIPTYYEGNDEEVLNNPCITGDGTYEIWLDRSLVDKKEEKSYVNSTEGAVTAVPDKDSQCRLESLKVIFRGMAVAKNFDISHMAIKNVNVVCDGESLIDDTSQLRLWTEGSGNLYLLVDFECGQENFYSFSNYIHITFTLKGIRRGSTPVYLPCFGTYPTLTVREWNATMGDPDEDYPWPSCPSTGSGIDYPESSYPATGATIQPSYPATGSGVIPTQQPTPMPSQAPLPTAQPSATPCPMESPEPSVIPTEEPEPVYPSAIPTEEPEPVYPTVEPTKDPGAVATAGPVRTPDITGNDILATAVPTKRPESDIQPTTKPENNTKPTRKPDNDTKPTKAPAADPTKAPVPTVTPSEELTELPEVTQDPSVQPGDEPVATPGDTTSSDQQPNGQPDTTLPENPAGPNRDELLAVSDPTEETMAPIPAATIQPGEEYDVDDEDEEDDVEEGEEIEDKSGSTYKVTQSGKKAEVEYSAPKENAKGTVKIPDKVTINGVSYKVTSVAANAFKNNDKIKKVVLNNNITSIGNNAFSGCKNLKVITITSKKLTSKSISKNAFKGISGKVVIKVPKGMKKKYKKLFRSKGLSKKVKLV